MQSKAKTAKEYLAELPEERRVAIETVRREMLRRLPKGYEESMQYGMICYGVPLSRYPDGYLNDKKTPLPYAALASQKNYMSVYLGVYGDKKKLAWFEKAYKASGKKLDMGKSCVRFKRLSDLPVEVIGDAVALTSVEEHIREYELGRFKLAKKK